MKRIKYLIILIVVHVHISFVVYGQELRIEDLIVGKWELVELPSNENDDLNILDSSEEKMSTNKAIIEFNERGHGFDHRHNHNFTYSVKNDQLKMGDRKYKIKKLDREQLIIEEIEDEYSIFISTYSYKRVND